MKSAPSAYLNVRLACLQPARDEHDLFVLHVDAFDGTDALREREGLGRAERLGRVPVAVLPDDRRIQAFLDGGPDAEHRRECKAGNLKVAAVADVDLVHLVEGVLRGVGGEDIGQSGVHAHADQRQLAACLPGGIQGELLVTQLDAGDLEGPIRMRLRQADRHVHVVRIGFEGAGEDGHHELRIDGIHDEVGAVCARELRDGRGIPSINLDRWELRGAAEGVAQSSGSRFVVVGEDHGLAPVGGGGDAGDRLAHGTDTDQQDSHGSPGTACSDGHASARQDLECRRAYRIRGRRAAIARARWLDADHSRETSEVIIAVGGRRSDRSTMVPLCDCRIRSALPWRRSTPSSAQRFISSDLHRGANNWQAGTDLGRFGPIPPHRLLWRANSAVGAPRLNVRASCLRPGANSIGQSGRRERMTPTANRPASTVTMANAPASRATNSG